MIKKIAVTQDISGHVREMNRPGKVAVYERGGDGWEMVDAFSFEPAVSIPDCRSAVRLLAQRLDGCRVLVSKKMEGIAYQELNRLGFHLFELAQVNDIVLDGVLRDINESENDKQPPIPMEPYSPMQDGHFFLDLIRLQETYTDISSKKAFRSFLEKGEFHSFNLLCSHLPPWVNEVVERRGLCIKEEQLPKETVKAIITFMI